MDVPLAEGALQRGREAVQMASANGGLESALASEIRNVLEARKPAKRPAFLLLAGSINSRERI